MKPLSYPVPTDLVANLRYRERLLSTVDREQRAAVWQAGCDDPVFYINSLVWQFNPTKTRPGEHMVAPFILWDFQVEAVHAISQAIDEGEDLLCEKSREMGISWIILMVFHHRWLTKPMQKFLCISRNADAVDKKDDPDSLFWKLDFINRNLPDWILPAGYDEDDTDCRKSLVFKNPVNGSIITGQASTGKAGVGGRATAIMVDEFSQINEDRQVLSRTSDTSKCRIFNGTHMGPETAFAELARRPDMKKLQMHWTQHPDKVAGLYRSVSPVEVLDKSFRYPNDFSFVQDGTPKGGVRPQVRSPWYDQQCKRKANLRDVAMDLDIDVLGSVSQFYDALMIRELVQGYATEPVWQGEVDYDKETGKFRGLVPSAAGKLKLWVRPTAAGLLPRSKYTAGADPSAGTGATPSSFSGFDALKGEKVLEYQNAWISPDEFAPIAVALCWLLSDHDGQGAYFCWENAGGVGTKLGQSVLKLGYRHIWYSRPEETVFGKPSEKPGWYPTAQRRTILHQDYRAALASRRFVNRSERALQETLGFQYDRDDVRPPDVTVTDDPSAGGQNHADIVTADAIAWKLAMPTADRVAEERDKRQPVEYGSLAWRQQFWENRSREEEYWRQWAQG